MATPTTLPATFVAGNVLEAAELNNLRGAFRVLQVVSTLKNDPQTVTSTSFVDITGLSVSVTPSSTTSKILVLATVFLSNGANTSFVNLVRDSTAIAQPSAGTSPATTITASSMANNSSVMFLDSPATTSATTYKLQIRVNTGTGYVNRSSFDVQQTAVSSITVFEVSA